MKKISIIIIVYKVAQYLEQCLESVIRQSYENLEIILVNGHSADGSDDGCTAICERYALLDKRIKIVRTLACGAADARNRGLAAAVGDYIGFVDGDDYIEPDMYAHMVSVLEDYKADIAVCGRFYEYRNTTLQDEPSEEGVALMTGEEALRHVMEGKGFYLHCWDKLYKRELWQDIIFPVDSYVEDRIVVNRILSRADRVAYDSTPEYHYRERRGSLSRIEGMAKKNAIANDEMTAFIYERHPALGEVCDKYLMYEYITSIQNVYLSGNIDREEISQYQMKLREMSGCIRSNSLIGAALRIKRLLALICPQLLVINTKIKMKKTEKQLVRFD